MEYLPVDEATETACNESQSMEDSLKESPAEINAAQPLPASSPCVPLQERAEWATRDATNRSLAQKEDKNPTSNTPEPPTQRTEGPQELSPAFIAKLPSIYPISETEMSLTLEQTSASLPVATEGPIQEATAGLEEEKLEAVMPPYPVPEVEETAENEVELVRFGSSTENCSSPVTRSSRASSILSEPEASGISYSYDGPIGHQVLHLRPTPEQWSNFPAMLSFARSLHAEHDGCFKIVLPKELQEALPEKESQQAPANAYRIRQTNHRTFWQVSTVPSDGTFSSSEPDAELSATPEQCFKSLKKLFNKSIDRQLRHIRYRVDVPAWTAKQRLEAGVPERSPIHPLAGDKLDDTKAIIPGVHTPYVYESAQHFGATFQLHAEDFRLSSLNHLYKGRKIWVVVPSTAVDIAEEALGRKGRCSQFMRHRAEFFFPEKLQKMGIPYRIVDQRPGETIVILPDAYHEGFSTGYTLAEAKNYADADWTPNTYQPCESSCQLATAIPADFMRPVRQGEERLDLCAGYDEDGADEELPEQQKQREQGPQRDDGMLPTGLQSGHTLKRPMEYDLSDGIAVKHARLH
ncbi:JmjC domain, hydroxylase domain-containing protein [Trichoderma novae-zelandiae]